MPAHAAAPLTVATRRGGDGPGRGCCATVPTITTDTHTDPTRVSATTCYYKSVVALLVHGGG